MHWINLKRIGAVLGFTMWLATGCAEAPIDDPSSSEAAGEALSIEEQEQELAGFCRADFQCPVPRIACRPCADGSLSCPTPRCSYGKCSSFFPQCPAPTPNPCAVTLCQVGTQCVEVGNPPRAECIPIDRCAAVRCRDGFHCDDGQCIPNEKVFCGGIAGIPCEGAGSCVDDPSDDCDPKNGGADCSGMCVCPAIGLCQVGSHWDSSPSVCGCVPNAGQACGENSCGEGTFCCNASCGICAPKGGSCIQIACLPEI